MKISMMHNRAKRVMLSSDALTLPISRHSREGGKSGSFYPQITQIFAD
jgi:hypothetical protein